MGWKEGEGLGRDGTGIKAPVLVQAVVKGVGIGASSNTANTSEGTYLDKVRSVFRNRYEQME